MSDFQISESTSRILKNFAGIGGSVVLQPGTTQKTMSNSKSMIAIAEFDAPWPMQTPVFALNELLANLSAYDKPSLVLEEKQFVIRSANSPSHVEYPYSDPSVVMGVPDKEFSTANPVAVFTLPAAAVTEIKKFSSINNLPMVTITLDGPSQQITVKPLDDKNPSSRSYSYPVHSDPKNIVSLNDDVTMSVTVKCEHINLLMDGGYQVHIGNWPYVYLTHLVEPIAYIVVRKVT